MPPDLKKWRSNHMDELDKYNCKRSVEDQIKKEKQIRNYPKAAEGDQRHNPFNPTYYKIPFPHTLNTPSLLTDLQGVGLNAAFDTAELIYGGVLPLFPIPPPSLNIPALIQTMYTDHLGDSSAMPCELTELTGVSSTDYPDYKCMDSNWDTRRKIVNHPNQLAKDSYDDFNRAVTYVDDILYGTPGIKPMGENYFQETGEKCILKKESTTPTTPKNKWTYIRNKAKGDALYRLGVGDNKVKDSGLFMSVVEDVLDVSPSRLVRIMEGQSQFEEEEGLYENCKTVNLSSFSSDQDYKFYDKNTNELATSDPKVIEINNAKTIEMFKNKSSTLPTQYKTSQKTSHEYIINMVCKLCILILALIVIYKILK